jgi:predicted DNA-binding transcriptional regulator AlpA
MDDPPPKRNMEYDFTLKFKLLKAGLSADRLVEKLGAEGCNDALVGVGQAGRIALSFTREASSASEAVLSAIADTRRAIPGATLVEAAPDYVGLTDVAELVGVTRQNMRKLMASHLDFPSPVHEGSSQVWHLESVLRWLAARDNGYQVEQRLLEIAHVAMQCNLMSETHRLDPTCDRRLRKLVTA